jgi:ribosomal RNA-processing protein 12
MFLSSANREIVRSAVGYVKVTIVSLPSSLIQPSLSTLIPALINWSHEHSNHFKVKIRHILERLVRKFGVDEIEKDVPEEDKKLITNIRKRQMRSKKKKAALAEKHEGDEDMDDAEVSSSFLPCPLPHTDESLVACAETSGWRTIGLRRRPVRIRLRLLWRI